MATAVVMPKLGNTVESSIIVSWHKKPGDTIKEGETLCDIETDKATMQVESPVSGTVLELFFKEGDDVPVLVNIAAVGSPGEDASSLRPDSATVSTASTPAPVSAPPTSAPVLTPVSETRGKPIPPTPSASEFVGISPRARGLAAQFDLDIAGIHGTGPGGRIIERDIQAALTARPKMTPLARSMVEKGAFVAPPVGSGMGGKITARDLQPAAQPETFVAATLSEDERTIIPVKGTRKVIAQRMLASLQTTAQLTLNAAADARQLLDYRKRLKASPEALSLQKVTINDLVLFVTVRTLLQFPDLNATFENDAITQYKNIHLGFAVDTPRGLIVPVIRSAQRLSLKGLAAESSRLAAACLDGKISPDELNGGTFTVTNLGNLGIESFTPVLNPPQVAILGVCSIAPKPVMVDDEVEFFPHIGLSLTINHQVVDGAPAARFLQALCQNIANLEILLAL